MDDDPPGSPDPVTDLAVAGPVEALVLWQGPCGRRRLEWRLDVPNPLRYVPLVRLTWRAPGVPERVDLVDVMAADLEGVCRGRTRRAER